MPNIIQHTYRLKRGTAQRWEQLNPVLEEGEPGFETDTNKLKIGDGFTPYMALPYIASGCSDIDTDEEIIIDCGGAPFIDETI